MRRSIALSLCAVFLVCSGQSMAELKKQRSWPAGFAEPPADLKRQYEYDPEAGYPSTKLLSMSATSMRDGKVIHVSQTSYKNGVPVSGGANWNNSLIIYHGFASIMLMDFMHTSKVKFSSSGPWPAKSFKVYSEFLGSGNLTKSANACTQKNMYAAGKLFPTLPGNIYHYDCDMNAGSSGDGATVAPGSEKMQAYYSDYLDTILEFSMAKQPPPGISPLTSTVEVEFLDKAGVAQKIVITEEFKPRFKTTQ